MQQHEEACIKHESIRQKIDSPCAGRASVYPTHFGDNTAFSILIEDFFGQKMAMTLCLSTMSYHKARYQHFMTLKKSMGQTVRAQSKPNTVGSNRSADNCYICKFETGDSPWGPECICVFENAYQKSICFPTISDIANCLSMFLHIHFSCSSLLAMLVRNFLLTLLI